MNRRKGIIIASVCVALLVLHTVFRVRVFVASARLVLMAAIVIAVAFLIWPSPPRRP